LILKITPLPSSRRDVFGTYMEVLKRILELRVTNYLVKPDYILKAVTSSIAEFSDTNCSFMFMCEFNRTS